MLCQFLCGILVVRLAGEQVSGVYNTALTATGIGFVAVSALTGENPYSAQQSVCVLLFLGYRMVESLTDIYNAIDQRSGRLDIVGKT